MQDEKPKEEVLVRREEKITSGEDLLPLLGRYIDRIMTLLSRLSPFEKKILSFLVDKYPNEYSVDRLAAWIVYSERTMRNNSPLKLVKMDLIERRG